MFYGLSFIGTGTQEWEAKTAVLLDDRFST